MKYSQLPITYNGIISSSEIDAMDHMNVAYYAEKFNLATLEFLELFDFGRPYRVSNEFGGFVLEHHIKYLAEVRLKDEITIYSRAIDNNHKLIHFIHFLVRNRDNKLSATCENINVHIDRKSRKSSPFPKNIFSKYELIKKAHQSLDWQAPISGIIKIKK
jgi:acyl-CoA thioester hydrolase